MQIADAAPADRRHFEAAQIAGPILGNDLIGQALSENGHLC